MIKHGSLGQAAPVTLHRFPQGQAGALLIQLLLSSPTSLPQFWGGSLGALGAQGIPPVCPNAAPARTQGVPRTESSLLKYLTKAYGELHVQGVQAGDRCLSRSKHMCLPTHIYSLVHRRPPATGTDEIPALLSPPNTRSEPAQVHSSHVSCLYLCCTKIFTSWECGGAPPAFLPPPLLSLPWHPLQGWGLPLIIPPAAFYSSSQTAQTSAALPPCFGPATSISISISIIITSLPTLLAGTDCAACLG